MPLSRFLLSSLFFLLSFNVLATPPAAVHLSCEYRSNPAGITVPAPHLGWQIVSEEQNCSQIAYRIIVADEKSLLDKNTGNIWDSKKVNAATSIQVLYGGGAVLAAGKHYYWKVMVWDDKGRPSAWSKAATWQMGLLTKADWKNAAWIAYEQIQDTSIVVPFEHGKGKKKYDRSNVLPMMRKEFSVAKKVKTATIYICGLGQFELSINGTKTGDHFLDPGWTMYNKEALYVSFDVTSQLKQGSNAIGVMLGNGFYYIPSGPTDKRYRKLTGGFGYPKMICRLAISYTDGAQEDIVTDKSWKTAPSPIYFSSIYGGEDYDANLEQKGWNEAGFNDKQWKEALLVQGTDNLLSQQYEPIRIFNHFKPVSITRQDTAWIYDLAQNASGIVSISVKGKKGDTVRLVPGELLKEEGYVNQNGTGKPYYFTYVLKGDGVETWQPRFSYYGFRYVQVDKAVPAGKENPNHLPEIISLEGLHIHGDVAPVGSFSCSNQLFNRIDSLIKWSVQSNVVSVFTDCPHREKLGWLEEVHLMGNSVHFNFDIATLARKSVHDMMTSQTSDGLVAEIAPEYIQFGKPFRDSPEWGSSLIIVPWYAWQWYGDTTILKESYPSMVRYLEYLDSQDSSNILYEGLGDWYDLGPKDPGFAQLTPRGVTATATWYYDLTLAANIATFLGKKADAIKYSERALVVKKAFNDAFFNATTMQVSTGSQAANSIAVYMGLIDDQYINGVVENIVKDVRDHNNALTAGDIGFRYLLKVLSDHGHAQLIYEMNNRTDVPGYGYQLAKGATALTESWMARSAVSNNHFMLGHIMEWFYEGLAGIRNGEGAPAFKTIDIKPEIVGDMTAAKADYQSPYGLVSSIWKISGRQFDIDLVIPANTTATAYLPCKTNGKVTAGGKTVTGVTYSEGRAVFAIGSGVYHFTTEQ